MTRAIWASVVLAAATGCGGGTSPAPTVAEKAPTAPAEGTKYLLAAEPAGVKGVIDARKAVKDGDAVTLVGRIGGSEKPFVEGRAVFTIVDPSLEPCAEKGCPTPWDYCCSTDELPTATATVKLAEADGKAVASDARKLLGLKELQTVVVTGTAKRDDAGNLTVLATGLFVRK
jgi:hypothetical protein